MLSATQQNLNVTRLTKIISMNTVSFSKDYQPNTGKYLTKCSMKTQPLEGDTKRRAPLYKPNIWSYDFVESLTSCDDYEVTILNQRVAKKLKDDFMCIFNRASGGMKLQLIYRIIILGISDMFKEEIESAIPVIESDLNKNKTFLEIDNAYFHLLQKHGFHVSQGICVKSLDASESTMLGIRPFEAVNINDLGDHDCRPNEVPLHRRVPWFEARRQINNNIAIKEGTNHILLELAKLNFSRIQYIHQKELKDVFRWWKRLGLIENMSFVRDRLVESFWWSVGVACEPHHSSLRKSLAKVITFILVIDDVYDIYGFMDELECFTRSVERWDTEEIHLLPESMKICFQRLYNTTNEIAEIIQDETGQTGVQSHLATAWAEFCKALLVEARWYYAGYTPTLDEYSRTAWISSSGPLLSRIVHLHSSNSNEQQIIKGSTDQSWEEMQDLVYHSSLIVRLWNDLATSKAELERGDSPSSILCYMREAKVTEDVSRQKIREMIESSWVMIEKELAKQNYYSEYPKSWVTSASGLIANIAKVAHFFYSKGDGFGEQDCSTREHILSILVEPVGRD